MARPYNPSPEALLLQILQELQAIRSELFPVPDRRAAAKKSQNPAVSRCGRCRKVLPQRAFYHEGEKLRNRCRQCCTRVTQENRINKKAWQNVGCPECQAPIGSRCLKLAGQDRRVYTHKGRVQAFLNQRQAMEGRPPC